MNEKSGESPIEEPPQDSDSKKEFVLSLDKQPPAIKEIKSPKSPTSDYEDDNFASVWDLKFK